MNKDNLKINEQLTEKSEKFIERMDSNMHYDRSLSNDDLAYEWLDRIEYACPYIDIIVRHPKVALEKLTELVKVAKARKVTVESFVHLTKNTRFIDKYDRVKDEVEPSHLLVVKRDETFNTYENRMVYTLIKNLETFILNKEKSLNDNEEQSEKVLEYSNITNVMNEEVSIELKITSKYKADSLSEKQSKKDSDSRAERIEVIKKYFATWKKSRLLTFFSKSGAVLVFPPIQRTNLLLKNTEYKIATDLWEYIYTYNEKKELASKTKVDSSGDDILKGVIDDTFLNNYFVLDSISSSMKEQKTKLSNYSLIMLKQQIKRTLSLLLNNGNNVSDQELIKMIASEIKSEKNKHLVYTKDVKDKFKSMMDEYLERTQDIL